MGKLKKKNQEAFYKLARTFVIFLCTVVRAELSLLWAPIGSDNGDAE